ncbi:hypothetical protein N825_21710 [Skermanella stibiiresistens SB22]|uniref:Methyl-accepting chemotaxis protein n=1 Tax=Skermanella stibiiresistens SB22 TaxID=1385369 RepID=W9GT37_9PROT|nr:cache domain-containing protein [Skermanella stibiiresistens]EWY37065.1 hypothetical protein N825_21710 [Skermanella stibiiresistens SB22]
MLNRVTIVFRLHVLIAAALLGIMALAAFGLFSLHSSLVNDTHAKLRNLGESALSIAAHYHALSAQGAMSEPDAKAAAAATIGAMRYDGTDYFWINDTTPVMVMHPTKPELDGKDLSDLTDPTGKHIFVEFVAVARRSGGGIVEYQWPKAGSDTPVAKASYVASFEPWGWVIGTGVYTDDVASQFRSEAFKDLGIALSVLIVVAGLAIVIIRGIRPLALMTRAMGTLARGDVSVDIPGRDQADEIGAMAAAVQVFKDNAVERARLEVGQAAERAAKERRAIEIERMIADFDGAMGMILRTVSSAATELDGTARSMASTAERTSQQATASAGAAEQTAANVQTVAAATEEMTGSLLEISRQVSRSTGIANDAVGQAERTDATIRGLAASAERINDVVVLISDIASQTNLLALNATIEAARAGEAGKGFAVVAGEVKQLAGQTRRATEEITAQINAIQRETSGAVAAVRGIGGTIRQMNEITTTIAAAVEEQNAATAEISRNVTEAATGTREVSGNVAQVMEASEQTGSAATQVLGAAGELSRQAEMLRHEVEGFLAGIRTA